MLLASDVMQTYKCMSESRRCWKLCFFSGRTLLFEYLTVAWLFSAPPNRKKCMTVFFFHYYLFLNMESNKAEKSFHSCTEVSYAFGIILCYLFFLSFPSPSPFFLFPWTILGWRLRSLEWALSNFYPWSFTASHDPWANGIAPSLFSLCTFAVLYFQYFWLIYIL